MEKRNTEKYCWVVMAAVWLVGGIGSYAQYQMTIFAPELMENLGLTTSQFSSLFTSPMIPAILFSIAGGMLADRIGVKKVVLLGLLLGVLGSFLRISAASYGMLFISMFLMGFSSTFMGATSSKALGSWFGAKRLVLAVGLYSTSGTLLQALASSTTAYLGSQTTAYIIACAGFAVVAVLWLLFMKERKDPEESGRNIPEEKITIGETLKIVLKSRTIWLACVSIMVIVGCTVTLSSFMATALTQSRGIDLKTAGNIAAMLSFGNMLGALVGPSVCRKIPTRVFLCVTAVLSALCAAFVWRLPGIPLLYIGMIVAGTILGAAMPLLLSIPMMLPEIGEKYAGSAGGTITTMQLLGGVVIPTYILTPAAGDNYQLLFLLAGACMLLMFAAGLFMPDLSEKSSQEE